MNDRELEHSGVKGMHWGVWNEETRARYSRGIKSAANTVGDVAKKTSKTAKVVSKKIVRVAKKASDKRKKKIAKREARKAQKEKERIEHETRQQSIRRSRNFKSVRKMTDKDLERAINRLNNEKKYKELLESTTVIGRGKKMVRDALVRAGEDKVKDLSNYVGGKVVKAIKLETEKQLAKSDTPMLNALADENLLKQLTTDETKKKKKHLENIKHSAVDDWPSLA